MGIIYDPHKSSDLTPYDRNRNWNKLRPGFRCRALIRLSACSSCYFFAGADFGIFNPHELPKTIVRSLRTGPDRILVVVCTELVPLEVASIVW
jgi:hypothetical protein